jgi:NTE family protein
MAIVDHSRRRLLTRLGASSLPLLLLHRAAMGNQGETKPHPAASAPASSDTPRVGIALGAGGANALAHILMLEVLDELGVRPHRIAGSSIGAIIDALYAAGMSATKMRGLVEQFIISPGEKVTQEMLERDALRKSSKAPRSSVESAGPWAMGV